MISDHTCLGVFLKSFQYLHYCCTFYWSLVKGRKCNIYNLKLKLLQLEQKIYLVWELLCVNIDIFAHKDKSQFDDIVCMVLFCILYVKLFYFAAHAFHAQMNTNYYHLFKTRNDKIPYLQIYNFLEVPNFYIILFCIFFYILQ